MMVSIAVIVLIVAGMILALYCTARGAWCQGYEAGQQVLARRASHPRGGRPVMTIVMLLADIADRAVNAVFPMSEVQRAHIRGAGVAGVRSDVIGCGQCTERPFAVKFPSGTTRIICDQHGQVARIKPQK